MHALVWHQSGGEPWAISVQGEPNPRIYSSMDLAIREARTESRAVLRGSRRAFDAAIESRSIRSSAMPQRRDGSSPDRQARQPMQNASASESRSDLLRRCRLSRFEQLDVKFADSTPQHPLPKVTLQISDMPRGTSTEIFDTAGDAQPDAGNAHRRHNSGIRGARPRLVERTFKVQTRNERAREQFDFTSVCSRTAIVPCAPEPSIRQQCARSRAV